MRGRPWWRGESDSHLRSKIRSLLKQHGQGQRVAEAEGISKGTFSRWCRLAGVSPYHLGAYTDDELRSLIEDNGGLRGAADAIGADTRTLWSACKHRGIKWRARWGGNERTSTLRDFSDDELRAVYANSGYSASEAARRLGLAKSVLCREMEARKIPRYRNWREAKAVPEVYDAWRKRIKERRGY